MAQKPADETAPWVVEVRLGVHSVIAADASLILSIPELNLTSSALSLGPIPSLNGTTTSTPFFVSANWTVDDHLPGRWWPHNLGTPKLYNLSLTLTIGDTPLTFNSTIGFRTIRLVQTRYSDEEVAAHGITPGDQWHFEVNGVAFYSKGTSVVPFDPFYARVTDDQVRWLVESAVKSGQNMVRNAYNCASSRYLEPTATCLGRWHIPAELDEPCYHTGVSASRHRHLLLLRVL